MLETIIVIIFVAIPAIVLHECAHGWMANVLGDPTARQLGRLTLNPIKHIDLVGTIVVPTVLYLIHFIGWTQSLLLFGWAKPVPVNFSRLNSPKRDMIIVALAGPATNLCLAFLLVQLANLRFLPHFIDRYLVWGVVLNLGLALFNLIPVPPLDGSRVVSGLLPKSVEKAYSSLEPFGIIIVIVLLNMKAFDFLDGVVYATAYFLGLR
ncbi:MAG: site-2 protease family protein [Candidatus Omnitrophica bacterium]|nr:site-2 protease family protein [Candidatus Omnitrophota bacterium]